jgi:hypothetical protein
VTSTRDRTEQRAFNSFVIGTGLSVLFGVTGASIVELADDGEWWRLLTAALAPVVLVVFLMEGVREGSTLVRLFR